jgi:Ca2+-binding RTX toxin-like protein
MPKTIIDSDFISEYDILSSGKTWIFTQGVVGESNTDQVIHESQSVSDSHIVLHAHLENDGDMGIFAEGDRTEITIRKTGWIDAYVGVKMTGYQQSIVNHGVISGENIGITASGQGAHVVNYGTISGMIPIYVGSDSGVTENHGVLQGAYGIIASGDGAKIILGEDSYISAELAGVEFHGETGEEMTLVNRGYLAASEHNAITALSSDNTVINRGEMRGAVAFGNGNDIFDNRGGKLIGTVYGSGGDDTYIIDTPGKLHLSESYDNGIDTIKSSVSVDLGKGAFAAEYLENVTLIGKADIDVKGNDQYNTLRGNSGDNTLNGADGTDFLHGGKGNDRLIGGAGIDFFEFRTGDGHDVITDFTLGFELIDITGWDAIKNFTDLVENHLSKDGTDLVIEAGTDSLRIENYLKKDLEASDFHF